MTTANNKISTRWFSALLTTILLSSSSIALISLSVFSALAQTEFEINANDTDLENEFREELDKWMLRAYEGDRDAQFKVGVLFTNDQFDRPDYEQAVYWYKQAARQGHVLAQYNLGHQYLTGVGVKKNEKTAMQWWLEAAMLDHALAQFNVGRAYYLGIGLPENHRQSKYWFERAAYNQEPKSIDILQQLGWYEGEIASQPQAPPDTVNADNVVQQSVLASPEPAERQSNQVVDEFNNQPDKNTVLTSRITPIDLEPITDIVEDVGSNTDSTDSSALAQVEVLDEKKVPIPKQHKSPVALYTNPAVRSVLIAIVDDRASLVVSKVDGDWSTVTSTVGFPVWVHGDFLTINGTRGTITGQAVNARSVPIITNGTVVGRLNRDESVTVLDKRKAWYRIIAPVRFTAWVKTDDFNNQSNSLADSSTPSNNANIWISTKPFSKSTKKPEPLIITPKPTLSAETVTWETESNLKSGSLTRDLNDNDWLFRQPAESYTLQLASFDDPVKVREFTSRKKFNDNPDLHQFTARGKNIEWTYFLYGSYLQKSSAEASKLSIKQKLAWVRTFGRLQQNRCVAWKTQLPTPAELNKYCTQ